MTTQAVDLVLPRPGTAFDSTRAPIPAPTEEAFVETFGSLLPPAQFLETAKGKAAYYEIKPDSNLDHASSVPDRVLLIHGVQTPALGMLPLARALKASFPQTHFVLFDHWGHGLSETPIAPYDMNLVHQLIDDLLERLQWSSVHLIGFSFGGVVTAEYVVSQSSKVKSFTIVAPAGLIRSANFTAEEKQHLRGGDEAAAQKWILEFLEGGDLVVPADWKERVQKGEIVAEAVREWQMREHPGHLASVVGIFRDGGVIDNGAIFTKAVETGIPSVVVLGGLDDLSTKEELNSLGFKDVSVVPQVGHGVVRQKAPEVAELITSFWRTLSENSSK